MSTTPHTYTVIFHPLDNQPAILGPNNLVAPFATKRSAEQVAFWFNVPGGAPATARPSNYGWMLKEQWLSDVPPAPITTADREQLLADVETVLDKGFPFGIEITEEVRLFIVAARRNAAFARRVLGGM